jgi:hypothetical protein
MGTSTRTVARGERRLRWVLADLDMQGCRDPRGGRLRVVHVAQSIAGGVASFLEEIAGAQAAAFGRDNVHFVVPAGTDGQLPNVDASQISSFSQTSRSAAALLDFARTAHVAIRRLDPTSYTSILRSRERSFARQCRCARNGRASSTAHMDGPSAWMFRGCCFGTPAPHRLHQLSARQRLCRSTLALGPDAASKIPICSGLFSPR